MSTVSDISDANPLWNDKDNSIGFLIGEDVTGWAFLFTLLEYPPEQGGPTVVESTVIVANDLLTGDIAVTLTKTKMVSATVAAGLYHYQFERTGAGVNRVLAAGRAPVKASATA